MQYFGLYKLAPRLKTDLLLIALALKRYIKRDLDRTTSNDGFVRFNGNNGEILGLKKKSGQVRKRAPGRAGCSKTVTLVAITLFFRADQQPANINAIRRDYDKYCGLTVNPNPECGDDFDNLFDQDLLHAQAGGVLGTPDDRFSASRVLIEVIGCTVLVSKDDYVHLAQPLAQKVDDAHHRSGVGKRMATERDEEIEECTLEVQVFADDSQRVARFHAQLAIQDLELSAMHVASL